MFANAVPLLAARRADPVGERRRVPARRRLRRCAHVRSSSATRRSRSAAIRSIATGGSAPRSWHAARIARCSRRSSTRSSRRSTALGGETRVPLSRQPASRLSGPELIRIGRRAGQDSPPSAAATRALNDSQTSCQGVHRCASSRSCGGTRSRRALCEELETWLGVLLALVAALLLYATLKAQAARAAEFPTDVGAPTLLFQDCRRQLRGRGAAPDRLAHLRGRRRRARARRRSAFVNSGTSYAEAVYALPLADDAAVDRSVDEVGERVIEGEIHERQRGRANLRRSARSRPTREPRAADERESVHDGGRRTSRPARHRHHDRIPADGAVRRRRVQPARAADVDAALRRCRTRRRASAALARPFCRSAPANDSGNGGRRPFGDYEAARAAPRGTKRTSTRCSRPACHSSGSAAAATSCAPFASKDRRGPRRATADR